MFCSSCGARNDDKVRFCSSCGAAMSGAGSVSPGARQGPSSALAAGTLIGLLVVVAALAGSILATHMHTSTVKARLAEEARQAPANAGPSPAGEAQTAVTGAAAPTPAPAPVSATDNVAEAQVVLEKYLAADLGHDGTEMKKYLGGQAAARFAPEVQGQEDLTVHSETVSGHTVKDANTLVFAVAVKWSPEGSSEEKTQTDRYVLKRTDAGWRITSTPAYPE